MVAQLSTEWTVFTQRLLCLEHFVFFTSIIRLENLECPHTILFLFPLFMQSSMHKQQIYLVSLLPPSVPESLTSWSDYIFVKHLCSCFLSGSLLATFHWGVCLPFTRHAQEWYPHPTTLLWYKVRRSQVLSDLIMSYMFMYQQGVWWKGFQLVV